MMAIEWEPGDVVIGTGRYAKGQLLVRAYDETWLDLNGERYDVDMPARPLVIIDPEDVEQVERFLNLCAFPPGSWQANDVLAALREFANPRPRIEEPQGLGAVVEDEAGHQWVLIGNGCWFKTVPNAQLQQTDWSRLNVVRVLSEGVTS